MNSDRLFRSPAKFSTGINRSGLEQSFGGSTTSLDITGGGGNKTTFNNYYNIQSPLFSFQKYQSMLPYRVIETLSTANFKNITARVSQSGWAWIVSGRRCYVWRYMDEAAGNLAGGIPKAPKCYELALPQSDISHKAELVCVFSSVVGEHKAKFPSALAVSPEGLMRYWPNVSQESNTLDEPVVSEQLLSGQECFSLVDIQPLGCILGTTTNSLVHINFDTANGQPSLSCHVLKSPQSLISGIGRRFSSLLFGSVPSATNLGGEAKQLIRIVRNVRKGDDNDLQLFPLSIVTLTDCFVQKWTISDANTERLDGEVDLERYVKEAFITELWNPSATDYTQLKVYPIDLAMQQSNNALLLFLCVNADVPNGHALGLFTISGDRHFEQSGHTSADVFESYQILRNISLPANVKELLRAEPSNVDLVFSSLRHTFNLVCPIDQASVCYIYNSASLFRVNLSYDGEPNEMSTIEEVDFNLVGDHLISMVSLEQAPLLLTFKNGFVSIRSNLVGDPISRKQLPDDDREYLLANNNDKMSVMKRALSLYSKGQKKRAELLVQKAFGLGSSSSQEQQEQRKKFELDDIVVKLSADILDQMPTSDPRWAHLMAADEQVESNEEEDASAANLGCVIVGNQLDAKYAQHCHFIELLQSSGAFDSLSSSSSSSLLPTKLVLCEHTEKLLAAQQLCRLYSKHRDLIDCALKKVIEKRPYLNELRRPRKRQKQSHLTNQDFFFREVTKIDDIFGALVLVEELALHNERKQEFLEVALMVSNIIASVFADVCTYRQSNGQFYQSVVVSEDCDYVPWSSGKHILGIREPILGHFNLLVQALRLDDESRPKVLDEALGSTATFVMLGQRMCEVVDILLDTYACQLQHTNPTNQKYNILKADFHSTRYKCLLALLKLGGGGGGGAQHEKTASLAEKYEDFDILIKICEERNDLEQLNTYIQQYTNNGFSEHLFEWYLKEGKQGKLLTTGLPRNQKLTDFLSKHNGLNWVHQMQLGQYREVGSILKNLAVMETANAQRKRTLLSIGKLAAIADGQKDLSYFDDNIELVNLQIKLPETVLQQAKLDKESLKVLGPEELILLLTGFDDAENCFENFQTCLKICEVMRKHYGQEDFTRALVHVWREAFLKDDWSHYSVDDIQEVINKSFFYRLVSNCPDSTNIREVVPPLNLLANDARLQSVANDKMIFFLKALYELIGGAVN